MTDNKDLKTLTLWDTEYKTLLTKKFATRKPYTAPDFKKVNSFIPGTIREIKVKVGQSVKKGEPILLLESMKMLNIVRTLVDGKVKNINIKVDETIPKNHLMIEFE